MLQFLERKGFLTHEPKGRGYIYSPAIPQEDYGRSKLGTFVDRYFKQSYLKLVSTLVEDEKVSEQELLDYLHELKNAKITKPVDIDAIRPHAKAKQPAKKQGRIIR